MDVKVKDEYLWRKYRYYFDSTRNFNHVCLRVISPIRWELW